nr:hypothetical protein [Gammaproteobacteria bacterium]
MTLPIIALLPLLTAWLPAVLVPRGRNACAWAAAAITAPALLLLLRLAPGVFAGEAIEADWPWIPALGLNASFRLDGLALLFALLILSFGVLVILYARYYLLQRDGVALFHVEAGSASPPLLLVHGWCCDHAYFAPQFEHFVD